jgi:NTE family protein
MSDRYKTITGISPESIKKFIENKVLLFRDLPAPAINTLSQKFTALGCRAQTEIIRQGEVGDYFYIIISGNFKVTVVDADGNKKTVGQLFPGDCAGEGALITREPRNATVVAETTAKIIRLSYEDFQGILKNHPNEFQAFIRIIGKRSRSINPSQFRPSPEKLGKFLSSVELLSAIDEGAIKEIENKMEWLFLPGGEVLMNQGDPGDSMYIVVNGGFHYIVRDEVQANVAEGRFSRGDIIGEMALLTGEKRSATVYSTRGSELVRLSTKTFDDFISNNPRSMLSITRTIARRLTRELNKSKRDKKKIASSIITFLAISPEVPAGFEQILSSGFSETMDVVMATRHLFLSDLAKAKNISLEESQRIKYDLTDIFSWLYDIEDKHDLVILLGDVQDPIWTETVLRHTDKIVLITTANSSPELSPTEIRFLGDSVTETAAERDLVILYSDLTQIPEGTMERLNCRKITRHYHIRLYQESDLKRLFRCLTGNSIGLALGGGGAKGFAHIGLLKAFSEESIHVDVIGGTSAGSIIAALYALGLNIEEIEKIAKKFMSEQALLEDYTLPLISLVRGKKFTKALKIVLGGKQVEDLWIPFFAVSTDLTDARKHVFSSGPLWKAVRASSSLPGILPPLFHQGMLLVDGALLDNVPGGLLKEFGAGFTIASSLGFQGRSEADKLYNIFYDKENRSFAPSFFRSLLWKLNPFAKNKNMGGIGNILMRSTMVNSLAMEKNTSREVDLFISLPVGIYGIFDWKSFHPIVGAGYTYAKQNISEWKKQLPEQ